MKFKDIKITKDDVMNSLLDNGIPIVTRKNKTISFFSLSPRENTRTYIDFRPYMNGFQMIVETKPLMEHVIPPRVKPEED